jgi:hypothetical protein
MVRSEGNMSLKNPVTPPGINPGTVRLVAQRLKHYATPGPNRPNILTNKRAIMAYTGLVDTDVTKSSNKVVMFEKLILI